MEQDDGEQIGLIIHSTATSSSAQRGNGHFRALYIAALRGKWEDVEGLVKNDPTLLHYSKFPPGDGTALHVATSANRSAFVKKLINKLTTNDLTLPNKNNDTALSIAAALGYLDIAEIMIRQNPELLYVPNKYGETPLLKAVRSRHKKMVWYLFQLTTFNKLGNQQCSKIFESTVIGEMYGIALKMLENYPISPQSKVKALRTLARRPQDIAIGSGVKTTIRYICSWIYKEALKPKLAPQLLEKILDQVLMLEDEKILELIRDVTPNVLFEAVKFGNVEFLDLLLKSFPYLIWEADEKHKGLFHAAIFHRQGKIFKLIYDFGILEDYTITHIVDGESHKKEKDDNMLHLAGKLPPANMLDTSRPNLQMQVEDSWFKEVQKIMPLAFTKRTNTEGLTPKDVFLEEHKELNIMAGTAMKKTANSCMLVSTLISTIVFAAAITVPGSSNDAIQTPIFNRDTWYMIFIVANAVALFSSSTSIIMLLSILTSRFVESENIRSMRAKMMCGFITLFLSITSMVIAFAAAVFLMFDPNWTWVPYFTVALAPVPIILFLVLHYQLGMGRI